MASTSKVTVKVNVVPDLEKLKALIDLIDGLGKVTREASKAMTELVEAWEQEQKEDGYTDAE